MASLQQELPVLYVLRESQNRWNVASDDLHQSLASFDTPYEACAWAIARAVLKRGRVFVDKTPIQLPPATFDCG
jgi:hypothetical protein